MKYCGKVGFATTEETRPGIWKETIVERTYCGDVMDVGSRWQSSNNANDDLQISNKLSIISDPYAMQNFANIRYAEFMGSKWKVSASVSYPRLILTFGGLYNGES